MAACILCCWEREASLTAVDKKACLASLERTAEWVAPRMLPVCTPSACKIIINACAHLVDAFAKWDISPSSYGQ